MKASFRYVLLLSLVGSPLLGPVVHASEPEPGDDRGGSRPKVRDHQKISGRKGSGKDDRPERPETEAEVKDLVKKFEGEREDFLQREKALKKEVQDAAETQREQAREQQKENLDRWKEEQKRFRDQVRERGREIKNELNEDLHKVVDSAKESGRRR